MCHGIILGVLGGLLVAKLVHRRLHGGGCGGHRHGWHGGGPWSGRGGWGGWRGRRGGGGPGAWFLSHRLGLDPVQEAEVEAILIDVRESFGELRDGGRAWIDEALETVAADDFDRARVENAAAQQGQAVDRLRGKLVDAAQKLHEILTPEQRRRLASLRGRFPFGGPARPPGTGPYRT
jgi:Spy/CpxP family protein refolding chaperone